MRAARETVEEVQDSIKAAAKDNQSLIGFGKSSRASVTLSFHNHAPSLA